MLDRTLAPRSVGDQTFNEKHGEIQLGGETITVAMTITDSKVLYKTGLPGEDGFHTASLHMWWDRKDRCRDEVLELGSAILQTFALR